MRRRRQKRHFLLHTAEHLFGVFSIFVIALLLGVLGKSMYMPATGQLAQTGESMGTSGVVGSGTIVTQSVSFGASRTGIRCENGKTVATYHFTVSPESGGSIAVSTPSGVENISQEDGRGFDRNYGVGSYTWSGNPRSGFMGVGSGVFSVEDICTNGSIATNSEDVPTVDSPTTTTTNSTQSSALVSVSFSVQPGPVATCDPTGSPLTPVFLATTKTTGGEFLVTSNTGMRDAHFAWGEYYFPNGKYSWNAVVKSGFVGEGALSGTFEINNTCPVSTVKQETQNTVDNTEGTKSTDSAVTQNTTTSTELPPLPRPQLHLFLDNVPTTDGRVYNKEQVEVRVTTAIAREVSIFTTRGTEQPKLLGKAVKDDLLSRPGLDVWTYIADMSTFLEGSTKLHVIVKHTDGRETTSERLAVLIKHPAPIAQTRTIITSAPLPVLRKETDGGSVETSVHVSDRDRTAVLARVSDPSSCGNAEECNIYCKSLPGVNDLCVSFAQEQLTPTLPTGVSLADDVSNEKLAELLDGGTQHAPEIPEYVLHPQDLRQFCAQSANIRLCTKILKERNLVSEDILGQKAVLIARAEDEQANVFTERTGTRNFVDTDGDGVTDFDEINLYHTDPTNADTDGDGFTDGAELLARTNPLGGMRVQSGVLSSTTQIIPTISDESVVSENPKVAGPTKADLLAVKNVEVAEVGESSDGASSATKLKIAGTAVPNAFVTLYVFSEPIVVTVKADGAGAWVYTLDKELSDGTHEVYSTITDAGGHILAKSDPLPFVKVAAAVSLGETALAPAESAPGFFTGPALYAMIAILIGILGIALSIIGFIVKQKASDPADLPGI